MGSAVAPTYACLFMHWLETTKLFSSWTGTKPHRWYRYIDDIVFFWHSSVDELQDFLAHINIQNPHIKFTAEYNKETRNIPFLDTEVSINDEGFIVTDLYKKSTAKRQYLLPSSCHPGHISRNIPYSLAYRLLRICSDHQVFLKRLEELRQDLLARQYPAKIVHQAFEKVKLISRDEALKRVERNHCLREKCLPSPIILPFLL